MESDMRRVILVIAFAFLSSGTTMAQSYKPVTAVKILTGWQCMALASSYEPGGYSATPAPVFAGPGSAARKIGTGAGVIIVPKPLKVQDSRTVMIWPNGKEVWIDVSQLTRWHSLSKPQATCEPALMSNGRYGFKTSN
jgi:hypothetical protein